MNATERAALLQSAALFDELHAAVDERTLRILDRRRKSSVVRRRGAVCGRLADGNRASANNKGNKANRRKGNKVNQKERSHRHFNLKYFSRISKPDLFRAFLFSNP